METVQHVRGQGGLTLGKPGTEGSTLSPGWLTAPRQGGEVPLVQACLARPVLPQGTRPAGLCNFGGEFSLFSKTLQTWHWRVRGGEGTRPALAATLLVTRTSRGGWPQLSSVLAVEGQQ